jgi:hypothetical protein
MSCKTVLILLINILGFLGCREKAQIVADLHEIKVTDYGFIMILGHLEKLNRNLPFRISLI